ncbi:MAG: hypothetical protein GC179_13440 [Anaerolineaceae bacterium]|nr:hypothetical protein [Anaerolineaceae bacterium]
MNAELEASLRQKLDFTEDDLMANRDGKLSYAQRHKLKAKRQGVLVIGGLGITAVFAVLLKIIFDNQYQTNEKLAIATLTCLAFAVGLLYFWLKWSQYTSDLDRDVAFASEGRMQIVTYHNRGNNIYRLRVNRESFALDRHAFGLLTELAKECEYCAVYYAPRSHILLSFEALDSLNRHI